MDAANESLISAATGMAILKKKHLVKHACATSAAAAAAVAPLREERYIEGD